MMNRVRKACVAAFALSLIAYLLLSRNLWLADLERQVQIGRDDRSQPIDISHPHTITWKIPGDQWKYVGECQVALVFDKIATIPWEAYRRGSMNLQVKMEAYAIPYEPAGIEKKVDGSRADRLIANFYYTTDTPLSSLARIWETRGDSTVEFGVCGVQRYPWEDTWIVLEVLEADPTLAAANPRLQIVGQHDHAVYGHIIPLRIARDVVLLFLGFCVIALAYEALKREK